MIGWQLESHHYHSSIKIIRALYHVISIFRASFNTLSQLPFAFTKLLNRVILTFSKKYIVVKYDKSLNNSKNTFGKKELILFQCCRIR